MFKELFEDNKKMIGTHWVKNKTGKRDEKIKFIEIVSILGHTADVKDDNGKTSTLSLDYILKNFSEI